MLYLIPQQINKLKSIIELNGFSWTDFKLVQENDEDIIWYLPDTNYYFQFRSLSITGQMYRDVFFYYYDAQHIEKRHWYRACNSFLDAISYFQEWVESLSKLTL